MNRPAKNVKTKPFPWKCRHCGQNAVTVGVVSYPVKVEYDGRVYEFQVDGLKTPRCENCGQVFPDAEANQQISKAFRFHAKLLTPQAIRSGRDALGMTQRELAALLGVAEATLSRWETGAQIQQRSLDKLLRLCFGCPQVRDSLASEEVMASLGTVVVFEEPAHSGDR